MANLYYTLQTETPISDIISELNVVNDDVLNIELSGNNLIVDMITCGSDDEDFEELNIGCILSNNGTKANLEFKDLSGIKLNATLPTSICTLVDPNNPLPVKLKDGDPRIIHDDPYCTKLTGNARAELKLNGNISVGGCELKLPTETREGNFWSYSVLVNTSDKIIKLERDLPLHPGDRLLGFTTAGYGSRELPIIKVINYDKTTFTIEYQQLSSVPNTNTILWILAAGGFSLYRYGAYDTTWINCPSSGGTLNLNSNIPSFGSRSGYVFNNTAAFNRVIWCAKGGEFYDYGESLVYNRNYSTCKFNQVGCIQIQDLNNVYGNIEINELISMYMTSLGNKGYLSGIIKINGGLIYSGSINVGGTGKYFVENTKIPSNPTVSMGTQIYLKNCNINNDLFQGEKTLLSTGTVSKVNRQDFQTDTDLSFAWYHAPITHNDITWRYEDIFVRNGETIRYNIKWMPISDTSKACIAFTDQSVWYPGVWKFNSENAYSNIEFDKNLEPLNWYSKSIQWTNDTGEDKQIRIWECATGATPAGYLRIWKATGGML